MGSGLRWVFQHGRDWSGLGKVYYIIVQNWQTNGEGHLSESVKNHWWVWLRALLFWEVVIYSNKDHWIVYYLDKCILGKFLKHSSYLQLHLPSFLEEWCDVNLDGDLCGCRWFLCSGIQVRHHPGKLPCCQLWPSQVHPQLCSFTVGASDIWLHREQWCHWKEFLRRGGDRISDTSQMQNGFGDREASLGILTWSLVVLSRETEVGGPPKKTDDE